MNHIPIEILLLDDSDTARKSLEKLLSEEGANIVHVFSTPQGALEFLKTNQVDIIVTDIIMPYMNGYEFVLASRQLCDTPSIIVSSLFTESDKVKSMRAYEVGALAIIKKPVGFNEESKKLAQNLLETIHEICREKSATNKEVELPKNPLMYSPIKLIGIGASLGGPIALKEILEELPPNYLIPIAIVQHIQEGYEDSMASWMRSYSKNKVVVVSEPVIPQSGTIYISPFGSHLVVAQDGKLQLSDQPPIKGLKPAISVLFDSMAQNLGAKSVAVLLTGMGDDGATGMLNVKKSGGYTIAQHASNCVMYGMPKAAINLNAAVSIIPLDQIAKEFIRLAEK